MTDVKTKREGFSGWLFSAEGWPYLLVFAIPLALVFEAMHSDPVVIFIAATVALIPAAALMGRATEELSAHSGPGIGGLLNVTFGNFPELLIALFALNAGLHELVKASLVGSVLGNLLLVLGAAKYVGGLGRDRQRFNAVTAQAQTTMLVLALGALIMPAVLEMVEGVGLPKPGSQIIDFNSTIERISAFVALILIASYIGGLIFSLVTHRSLFNPAADDDGEFTWPLRRSLAVLGVAAVVVALMSEILVGSITEASKSIGLSQFFVGAFVVAIVGNAAEHWVAVLVARKNKLDLAINIAIGSAAQIALFVAPVLVLASFFVGPHPMPLVFNGLELAALGIAVITAIHTTNDGESNWFEGLQLLALYAVIGVVFFYA
ncbi:MAG: calcium/proton exchanger [Thermoleophilaceae bacterium]|nr:calcium/proton exchanger [Thermoleophilaceae bacterium]